MIATVVNALAWAACAVLLFLLLKDFISVERENKILNENAERRDD